MGVPTEHSGDVTVRVSPSDPVVVRRDPAPDHVVSVLFGRTLEAWRRGWGRTVGRPPEREMIVAASDISRGASTASPMRISPGRGLAYTIVEPDVEADRLIEAVAGALDELDTTSRWVFVDDIEPFATRVGVKHAGDTVRRLTHVATESGGSVTVGYSLTPETTPVLASLHGVTDRISGVDPETAAEVDALRRDDPTTFGYARRNWAEAQRGIGACTRNYPQAKQIHASLSVPSVTTRTLGATLSGLVTLGVLDTWGDTVGPTRYDLTGYDPSRMASVGVALAATAESVPESRSE